MTRYVVKPVPYGATGSLDVNAPWSVVDTAPVAEEFVTRMGATVAEDKAPPWRQVAFCMRESHAELIAFTLNAYPRAERAVLRAAELSAHPLRIADDIGPVPRHVWSDLYQQPPRVTNLGSADIQVSTGNKPAKTIKPGETEDV